MPSRIQDNATIIAMLARQEQQKRRLKALSFAQIGQGIESAAGSVGDALTSIADEKERQKQQQENQGFVTAEREAGQEFATSEREAGQGFRTAQADQKAQLEEALRQAEQDRNARETAQTNKPIFFPPPSTQQTGPPGPTPPGAGPSQTVPMPQQPPPPGSRLPTGPEQLAERLARMRAQGSRMTPEELGLAQGRLRNQTDQVRINKAREARLTQNREFAKRAAERMEDSAKALEKNRKFLREAKTADQKRAGLAALNRTIGGLQQMKIGLETKRASLVDSASKEGGPEGEEIRVEAYRLGKLVERIQQQIIVNMGASVGAQHPEWTAEQKAAEALRRLGMSK